MYVTKEVYGEMWTSYLYVNNSIPIFTNEGVEKLRFKLNL